MTTMKIFETFILFCLFTNIIQVLSQDCEEGACTVTQSSPTSSPVNPFTTSSECSDCPAGFKTKGSSDLNASLKLAVIIIYTIVLIAILLLVAIEILRRRRSLCFGKMKILKNDKCQHGEIPMGDRSQDAQDYGVPNNGETATYEEVSESAPSVYAELNRNQETEEDNTYQKLLKPGLDYVIPADKKYSYEEVPNSSPSVYAELNRNKEDQEANDNTYQKLLKPGLDYVIPADKKSSNEEVPNSSPSVYAELNRNLDDQEANDCTYQKLLKPGLDYVIPADAGEELSYEKVEKKKSPPGYTELDQTKRKDVDASYQKLTKK